MSGIPRDYPIGLNEFPQVIRKPVEPCVTFRLIIRDPHGRESTVRTIHITPDYGKAVGDGAAECRKDAVGPTPPERAPAPQQSGRGWLNRLTQFAGGKSYLDIDPRGDLAEQMRADVRALLEGYTSLLQSGGDLVDAACRDENTIGRMRSGINEAIALLEGGTEYERMHVAGTLRGAL